MGDPAPNRYPRAAAWLILSAVLVTIEAVLVYNGVRREPPDGFPFFAAVWALLLGNTYMGGKGRRWFQRGDGKATATDGLWAFFTYVMLLAFIGNYAAWPSALTLAIVMGTELVIAFFLRLGPAVPLGLLLFFLILLLTNLFAAVN